MNRPILSVSRGTRKIGIFDGFELVKDFERYTNEDDAIRDARQWVMERTGKVPEIVYPVITKITMR